MREPPRPRILYLSLFSWMSVTAGRFLAPFLEHEGKLTDSWIGATLAVQYGLLSLLAPMFGSLADARERRRPHRGRAEVLVFGVVFSTVAFLLHGLHRLVGEGSDSENNENSWVWLMNSMAYHLVVQAVYAIGFSTMFPVLDGLTVDYLQQLHGDSTEYGKERMYGAISWGVTNLVHGVFIDVFGVGVYYPLAAATSIYSIITLVMFTRGQEAFAAQQLQSTTEPSGDPEQSNGTSNNGSKGHEVEESNIEDDKSEGSPSTLSLVAAVFGTVYGAGFCFCYVVLNTGFSVVENLVFLFFEFLGGSNTLCGVTAAVSVSFEIPMFHVAPSFLRKFGVGWMLLLANGAYWIRVTGYILIPKGQAMWVFLLEPLHGFTYAGAQTSAVEYVNKNVPTGYEASGQGIVNFVRGLASVLGLYLGGLLQDIFGPRTMYTVFVAAVTVGMSVFASIRCCYSHVEQYQRIDTTRGDGAT